MVSFCKYILTKFNNIIQSHNRELNKLFPAAHLSLLQFIAVIEELSREKARILREIRQQNYFPPKRKIAPRKIPLSYK